uniref:Hyp10 n=1 Tax=Moniliophthora roreri (strain MCA 2997) TaxID=1381753 RepID=F2WVK1_MONRO|nr:hyp10 [Moniliophthora roreri]ADO51593.1 hyp10 [Moniliophthora roreri]
MVISQLNQIFINLINDYSFLLDYNIIITSISLSILILLSGKASRILGEVQKVVGIAAGGTIIYNSWVKPRGGSSGSESNNNNNNNDKDKDKKTSNKDEQATKNVSNKK